MTEPKKETPENQRPTAEQLQAITQGGSYTFNPKTGKAAPVRKPTAAPKAKGAK